MFSGIKAPRAAREWSAKGSPVLYSGRRAVKAVADLTGGLLFGEFPRLRDGGLLINAIFNVDLRLGAKAIRTDQSMHRAL